MNYKEISLSDLRYGMILKYIDSSNVVNLCRRKEVKYIIKNILKDGIYVLCLNCGLHTHIRDINLSYYYVLRKRKTIII